MKKILIADDHTVVREGLKRIVEESGTKKVTAEASNGHEVLEIIRKEIFDAVVLDISMPKMSGLDVLKQLKAEKTDIPILVLSMHPEDQYAVRVLKAGASGYLTKDSASDQLVTALDKIIEGGKYVSAELAEKLANDLTRDRSESRHQELSDREFQVLCKIGAGNSVTDIARTLKLSPKTVSTYRTRILEKLELRNSTEIIQYAVTHNLI